MSSLSNVETNSSWPDFIRPGMNTQEQLEKWKMEYKKIYEQLQKERKEWENEKSQGLLLLNDYRRDNQQLETEKRQWEQEREFGLKLQENLKQRIEHYLHKIQLIEKVYNIDIDKLDHEMYKEHSQYDPSKIDYIKDNNDENENENENKNKNKNKNKNEYEDEYEDEHENEYEDEYEDEYENATAAIDSIDIDDDIIDNNKNKNNNLKVNGQHLLTMSKLPLSCMKGVANESTMSNVSENGIPDLQEEIPSGGDFGGPTISTQTKKLFEKKRRESAHLRKEGENLEQELINLRRHVNKKKQSNNAVVEHPPITAKEAQVMISESELVSELMNAWSIEMTNLLEQMSGENKANDENTSIVDNSVKKSSEKKSGGLQQLEEKMKTKMAHKCKQVLEKHHRTWHAQDHADSENNDDNNNNNESKEEEKTSATTTKPHLSSSLPSSRILMSRLTTQKEIETDEADPNAHKQILEKKIALLQKALEESQQSKLHLIQRTSLEIERMRGLLKSYNPDFRYRRILDRLLEDNRYHKVLDQLSDDNYEPHELDSLLAHIAHLKHHNQYS